MALSPLLVDAKKEYTTQLGDLLSPYILNTISKIYDISKKKTSVFREQLRQVPNWNASMIEQRTLEIERRNPQLQDLIAACCVSYTKVLGSIRLNPSQNSNVRVALPQSSDFIHSVYTHVAKEFFYDPKLVFGDRHTKAQLLRDAVEESVRHHVPIRQLLQAYLSTAVDSDGMDPMAAAGGESPRSPQAHQVAMSPPRVYAMPPMMMPQFQQPMQPMQPMQQMQQIQPEMQQMPMQHEIQPEMQQMPVQQMQHEIQPDLNRIVNIPNTDNAAPEQPYFAEEDFR